MGGMHTSEVPPINRGPAPAPATAGAAAGVSMIFATPLMIRDWPDSSALNLALCALIADRRLSAASAGKSNVGGWHSAPDFIQGDAAPLATLRQRIRQVVTELTRQWMAPGDYAFIVAGWANVLGAGDYNAPHNHPNATWSGVYYLTGTPPAPQPTPPDLAPPRLGSSELASTLAGKIEFFDPRPAAGMVYATDNMLQRRCLFTPRPGCMLVFPSWLQHMVHPHHGSGERISVAFNVTVSAKSS